MTRWVHRNLPRALLRLRLRHVLRRPRGPLLWTTGTTANAVFCITPSGAFLLRPAVYFYSGVDRADLLVIGAYGHSRVRELVLGGVTRHLLRHMTIPVLMSH